MPEPPRTLKVTLIGVVVAFAAAAISYVKSQPPPKPKKLTEEKAWPARALEHTRGQVEGSRKGATNAQKE